VGLGGWKLADLFVSYKSEDRGRVAPLVAALEAQGVGVWWDAHISGGSAWRDTIESELNSARCVLVVWSKRSVGPEGSFVRDEATRALRRGAYLPVRIDAVEPPLGFGETQALPLMGWKGDRTDPRYMAVLGAVRARLSGEMSSVLPGSPAPSAPVSRRALIAGGAALGAAALGGGLWWMERGGSAGSVQAKRVAVMPFANLSGDPDQAYFADGIAEELRGALARLGLEVIGRTSSEAVKNDDAKTAAAKLGAGSVLTGSVRRSPSLIRVSAQLVEGVTGVERWQNSYDRPVGDALKVQSDIAEKVAGALRIALGMATRAAIALGGTANAQAQDILLKARAVFRASDSGEAACRQRISACDAALALDPGYVDALTDKAGTLMVLTNTLADNAQALAVYDESERLLRRAIALAPQLALPHATIANTFILRLRFAEALSEANRALALGPNEPRVLALAAQAVRDVESPKRAVGLFDQGIALDPLSASAYGSRASALNLDHRAIEGEASARKSLAITFRSTNVGFLAVALILQGKMQEALAALAPLATDDFQRLTYEACIAARMRSQDAAAALDRLRKAAGDSGAYQYAQVHAQAQDADQAFAALDTAMRIRDSGLSGIRFDPMLDPIRADARMAALIKRLGFPA